MSSERLDQQIDELAGMCVDWRNARRAGINPRNIRVTIVATILEIANHKANRAPDWFRLIIKDLKQLDKE